MEVKNRIKKGNVKRRVVKKIAWPSWLSWRKYNRPHLITARDGTDFDLMNVFFWWWHSEWRLQMFDDIVGVWVDLGWEGDFSFEEINAPEFMEGFQDRQPEQWQDEDGNQYMGVRDESEFEEEEQNDLEEGDFEEEAPDAEYDSREAFEEAAKEVFSAPDSPVVLEKGLKVTEVSEVVESSRSFSAPSRDYETDSSSSSSFDSDSGGD